MTLDEAIQHALLQADTTPCGAEHQQLALWLADLKQRQEADKDPEMGAETQQQELFG